MNTIAKWMIVVGIIIGLVAGFFGGYYWKNIKEKVSSSADTLTQSPLTAAQQTNENQIFQQAFQDAWTDYVKANGIPGQGDVISLNLQNFRNTFVGVAKAQSGYRQCTQFESDSFIKDLISQLQQKLSIIDWGTCEAGRYYNIEGTVTIDTTQPPAPGGAVYKVTVSGKRTLITATRDPKTCKETSNPPWTQPFSYTFYTSARGITTTPPDGPWVPYCKTYFSGGFNFDNPNIDKTCPCKPTPTPTPAPTPTQ